MNTVKLGIERGMTSAQELGSGGLFGVGSGDCLLCLATASAGPICDNCERLLAPTASGCPRCGSDSPLGEPCRACRQHPPEFDEIVTAFAYRFPLDRLVRRFKFAGDLAVGRYLGGALARAVSVRACPDLILASPMTRQRLRERGFSPALLLARQVAACLSLPLDARALSKIRHTPPQTGLDRRARRRNVRGAFSCSRPLDGLHVALVDDVVTTGATLSAIARELKASGARRVTGWMVARTPVPRHSR